ncbi:MAG: DUF362 domain-containing protein [Acidimicrobiia bacterium]
MTMTRREFLSRSATVGAVTAATAVTGLGGAALLDRRSHGHRARVAVVKQSSYDGLESVVYDGLRAIGVKSLDGKRVLLKPNLVEFDPDAAINTDPRLVAATVLAVRRLGAGKVVVGEGPGHRRDTDYIVAASGLYDALEAVDATFVDLNTAAVVQKTTTTQYSTLGSLWLPRPVVDADVVISMPKMKTHHWAGTTLSLKNLFGVIPGRIYGWPKNVLHWSGLQEAILDIAATVRPDYAIVDGITAMEGNGPIQGVAKNAGLLVFGNDLVATDHTAAYVMGFDPDRIWYLKEAAGFLGVGDLDKIGVEGDDIDRSTTDFGVLPQFARLLRSSPAAAASATDDGNTAGN